MTQPTQALRTVIPQECKEVTHVNLADAKHIRRKVKTVQDLSLENLNILDLSQGKDLKDKDVIACLKKFPTITKLNLTGCRKITDKTLKKISKLLLNLTHLKLSVCPLITDKGLASLTNCRKLEYLNLTLDFNTCDKRYNVSGILDTASDIGVRPNPLHTVIRQTIKLFIPKVHKRIEEKTKTEITLEGLQNTIKKCDTLKTLFVPCILETKEDLLKMMKSKGDCLGKTAAKLLENLPDEAISRGLQILDYEQDPSLVWASPQEWYV